MGFMIASILVLVRELTSQSFRNVSQLEAFTGRTVMGQVPLLKTYKRDETLTYLSRNPTSAPSEAVHNMQTSIRMLNIDQPPQVIMLTSCVPGEGKTTLSLALAHSLASLGRRVLVVEGDVRRNVMRPHFPNVTAQGSIMDVLSGDKTPEEGVTPINVNGVSFDLLFGAKHTSNAMNIFASTRFSEMIKQLRELYDVVVIDTPPVLVVPDARAIAPHSDALIMVVKWDSTTRQQVAEGIRMFSSINLPISGFVLNQISPVGMKRYGYGSEYGAYSNYGSKYYSNSG